MLGKLMKYELQASSRIFLLLYGALILLSLINSGLIYVSGGVDNENPIISLIQGLFMFCYVIMIIATFVVTIVIIILRFYKNLLGDEGYLMFTLPVNADSHIINKLIISVLWSILSTVVIIVSILIVMATYDPINTISMWIDQISVIGFNIPLWSAAFIFTVIICYICMILMFYGAMAIGMNLTKNRLLGSFLGYLIMYVISQVIGLINLAVIYFADYMSTFEELDANINGNALSIDPINSIGLYVFILINVTYILLSLIYYFTTRYFIKNRLNLS